MPLQIRPDDPNWYMGHRPGSYIRNPEQRFLHDQRRLSRRNPAEFALRHAPSRRYNAEEPTHIKAAAKGWTEANEGIEYTDLGHWGAVSYPVAEARSMEYGQLARPRRPESNIYYNWKPVMLRAREPMSRSAINKQQAWAQRNAERGEGQQRSTGIVWARSALRENLVELTPFEKTALIELNAAYLIPGPEVVGYDRYDMIERARQFIVNPMNE